MHMSVYICTYTHIHREKKSKSECVQNYNRSLIIMRLSFIGVPNFICFFLLGFLQSLQLVFINFIS